jgi:hypothetical protein
VNKPILLVAMLAIVLLAAAPALTQTAPNDIEASPVQETGAVQTAEDAAVDPAAVPPPFRRVLPSVASYYTALPLTSARWTRTVRSRYPTALQRPSSLAPLGTRSCRTKTAPLPSSGPPMPRSQRPRSPPRERLPPRERFSPPSPQSS